MLVSRRVRCRGVSALVRLDRVSKRYPLPGAGWVGLPWRTPTRFVDAVDRVSLQLEEGTSLAVVGESGSGKTTLSRLLAGLLEPTAGHIEFQGRDLRDWRRDDAGFRRNVQIVFQDPYASLNPTKRVLDIVGLPLSVHGVARGAERTARVRQLLETVGLAPADTYLRRFPRHLSGGQRQRVAIARAIALHPKLVIADEPVSALDVSSRAQVLNLFVDLKQALGLSYFTITHDLAMARFMADTIAVMYLGEIVEVAPKRAFFAAPRHPYSRALLAAVPQPHAPGPGPGRSVPAGAPSPLQGGRGCRFAPRCPLATDVCRDDRPELVPLDGAHAVACHHPVHDRIPEPAQVVAARP